MNLQVNLRNMKNNTKSMIDLVLMKDAVEIVIENWHLDMENF